MLGATSHTQYDTDSMGSMGSDYSNTEYYCSHYSMGSLEFFHTLPYDSVGKFRIFHAKPAPRLHEYHAISRRFHDGMLP